MAGQPSVPAAQESREPDQRSEGPRRSDQDPPGGCPDGEQQRLVDLGYSLGELLRLRVEQLVDARQGYAGAGQGLDPDQRIPRPCIDTSRCSAVGALGWSEIVIIVDGTTEWRCVLRRSHLFRVLPALLAAVLLVVVGPSTSAGADSTQLFVYQVSASTDAAAQRLFDEGFDVLEDRSGTDLFVLGDAATSRKLRAAGFQPTITQRLKPTSWAPPSCTSRGPRPTTSTSASARSRAASR